MKLTEEEFLKIELEGGIGFHNPEFVADRDKDAQMMINYKDMKAIDYGCGTGVYAERFRKAGFDIVAQDVSKAHRDYIKNNCPDLKVIAEPIKKDLMLFIEVAEHMTDEEITKAIEAINPKIILFSSTSENTDHDEIWGHVNVKPQTEWIAFWESMGYKVIDEPKNPTKWTKLLEKMP
jgi:2-polyprenyl-3-methyl-5-hydroxy-6-metoxy-1,4-benzoquinol methylase